MFPRNPQIIRSEDFPMSKDLVTVTLLLYCYKALTLQTPCKNCYINTIRI